MSFLDWNEQYEVNIAEVDEQHKRLFSMVNEMHEAMKMGRGDEVTGKILKGLIDYCGYHFITEERLMNAHGYHDYITHKKAHDELTEQTKRLYARYTAGEPVLSFELMDFLKKWLRNHILGMDKAFGPYLKAKGVR